MLNLHPPFRRANPDDRDTIGALLGQRDGSHPAECVVAEEGGTLFAVLDGRPEGATWRIDALAVARERAADLGPRVLAVADALAADDGLESVTLDPASLDPEMRRILDGEGFRPAEDGSGLMVRPVVPQG